ncbi:MAG: hypothetical protein Tsb002_31510 [Wenzhouxiangellaceae bacterium]
MNDASLNSNPFKFVIDRVMAVFPAEGEVLTEFGRNLWSVPEGEKSPELPWSEMLEHFASLANARIEAGDMPCAEGYFNLIEALLMDGDDAVTNAISVAYAETIMWNVKDPSKRRAGWKIVPPRLWHLYIEVWGEFKLVIE